MWALSSGRGIKKEYNNSQSRRETEEELRMEGASECSSRRFEWRRQGNGGVRPFVTLDPTIFQNFIKCGYLPLSKMVNFVIREVNL